MPAILIAHGANRAKYPVTAFDSVDAGQRVIGTEAPQLSDTHTRDGVLYEVDNRDHARQVADVMFDEWYFVGDPPMTYELTDVDGDLRQFTVSND